MQRLSITTQMTIAHPILHETSIALNFHIYHAISHLNVIVSFPKWHNLNPLMTLQSAKTQIPIIPPTLVPCRWDTHHFLRNWKCFLTTCLALSAHKNPSRYSHSAFQNQTIGATTSTLQHKLIANSNRTPPISDQFQPFNIPHALHNHRNILMTKHFTHHTIPAIQMDHNAHHLTQL